MVKNMQKLLQSHKKYLIFTLVIIALGVLAGIIYYNILGSSIKENIIMTVNNLKTFEYNAIIKDLVIMSILLVSSFFIVGIPLSLFYLFYEGLSIGFLINIFYVVYKIKGILYILVYILLNKLITLILIIFFIKKIINISRLIIGLVIYKNNQTVKNKLISNFRNSLYIILFTLIINIILYFISPSIANYFNFLIK